MKSVKPALLGISHGTSSPAGQAAVAALMHAVGEAAPQLHTGSGFVDVQVPDVAQTVAALPDGRAAVIVPLLLSAGFHVHVDLTRAVREEHERTDAAGAAPQHPLTLAGALGPDPLLAEVLALRLRQAGLRRDDVLILAAAGSSDARAVTDCLRTGVLLSELLGRPVITGFLSAAEPRLTDAVASARRTHPDRRIVVSSYLLAPGYFQSLALAAGADVTTAPLLVETEPTPPELVQIVLERYASAAATALPLGEAVAAEVARA